MENKEIFKKKYGKVITDLIVDTDTDKPMSIKFGEDGEVDIEAFHSSNCCESVYADFSPLKYQREAIVGKELKDLLIKEVVGMGFLLCFEIGYKKEVKVFIPCYNYQNGYYSSSLELRIKDNDAVTILDIGNLVEDHIN